SFVMRARAPGPFKSDSGPSFTIDCADVAVEPQRTGEPPTTGHLSVARRMKERARSPAIDMAKLQTVWGRSLHGLFLQTPFLVQLFGGLSRDRKQDSRVVTGARRTAAPLADSSFPRSKCFQFACWSRIGTTALTVVRPPPESTSSRPPI